MATINNNTVTLEESDILNLFSGASAINDLTDGDVQYTTDFLVEGVETETEGGETTTTRVLQKVNAAVVKAYLVDSLVTTDQDGNLVINGVTTDLNVNNPVVIRTNPQNENELQYSTDGGSTFTSVLSLASYLTANRIVNDLTSGGTTNVLSAEQGKILNNTMIKITGSDQTTYPEY